MNTITYAALAVGLACLLVGWITSRKASNQSNLVVSWLLLGAGTAFLTFALFPGSSADGTVLGFRVTGALGALLIVWMYGMSNAKGAMTVDSLDAEIQRLKDAARRPQQLGEWNTHSYALKNAAGKKLGLVTGDIQNVKCGDIWVSSENTNMEMARFFDRSVSASIRYYGSERDAAGNVTADLIADELKKVKGNNLNVQPTSIFVTGPGKLSVNGVKNIFHVAAVHGQKPMGYRPVDDLEGCVRKALEEAEKYKAAGYKSILFPLLATGTARGELEPISRRLIQTSLSYLEKHPESTIETVYFLTWSDIDLETCQGILAGLNDRVAPI
jgi:O-acetyl-ADP-ribose deacetylase (regulator of RNase III)